MFGHVGGEPKFYRQGHQGRKALAEYLTTEYYALEDKGHGTPCWIWAQSEHAASGYGQFNNRVSRSNAHRAVFEIYHDITLPKRLVLDHLCRQRTCVNPDHMEPVTVAENTRRGRSTKLTLEDVAQIEALYFDGLYSQRELAGRFGVSQTQVSRILNGHRWSA